MHKSLLAFTALALFAFVSLGNTAAQTAGASISTIANRNGYTLHWLLPERSVSLNRPGLVIVVRPGALMYEVNDRVEFTDTPPRYGNGDLYVSSTLAARIARLAALSSTALRRAPQIVSADQPAAGGAITMNVRPQPGSEALSVTGHAPSNAPVTITLLATVDPDVPTIVVSRQNVQPDVNGNFQAIIPNAPDYMRDTFLRVLATSGAGVTPASAQVVLGAPNTGVSVPAEQTPQP